MNLLITYETFINSENGQVYPLELPNYFVITGSLTIEQYYQKVMLNCQIIINNYCQNVLSKAQWNLDSFSNLTKESVTQILIAEFIYLHENQLFFKKTNDVQYSTAGQQTFTFSPEIDKSASYFIPENVKKMIENAGILNFSSSILNQGFNASQLANEFLDGVMVTDVRWDSKANSSFVLNGNNQDVIEYLLFLSTDYISKNNTQWLQLIQNANLFSLVQNKINSIYILTAPNIYPNKTANDYAQVDDIIKTYNVINENVQNNTNDITNLTSIVENLESNKVSNLQLNNSLTTKANINLGNVAVGTYPVARSVIVDTNGNIQFSTSGGAIFDITQWSDVVTYVAGRMVFVYGTTPTFIWIATNKAGNKNKDPFTENTFWQKSNLNIDLTNYYTKNETNINFLNKTGNIATMATSIDMSGYTINNASNLLDDSIINDSIISDVNIWTSQQTNNEIQKVATNFKDYIVFDVWEFKQNFAKGSAFTYDDHFISLQTLKSFPTWDTFYTSMKMTQEEIDIFVNANPNPSPDIFPGNSPIAFVSYFSGGITNSATLSITANYDQFKTSILTGQENIERSNLPTDAILLNNNFTTLANGLILARGSSGVTASSSGPVPIVFGAYANPYGLNLTTKYYIQMNDTGSRIPFQPQTVVTAMRLCFRRVIVKVPL